MVHDPHSADSSRPDAGGRERRRHPRAPADWPLTIELHDGSLRARVRDISRAGVCFFLERAVPMMTLLAVRLELPTNEGVRQVSGHGAVVRCERISDHLEHFEVAVFLHDMADSDRAVLDEYVRAGASA